jgi:hypothetical protein
MRGLAHVVDAFLGGRLTTLLSFAKRNDMEMTAKCRAPMCAGFANINRNTCIASSGLSRLGKLQP